MSNADSMTSNVDVDSETDACRFDSGEDTDQETDRSHLEGVEDGCGCTEIWEHLSEQRDG
ncbi:hypothetical protein [Halocatena pleomorpha]|uniref:Uncharacterized protein n=1 Tax=Halocatena pleomorpha TaxID=1785090 RepID=A0A3P3RHT4_9EURY|nr:hypothetical protein [Halocatena pleomorpha]RRJ32508.1 hypothetical protein EIK79_04600 [Halocatena pleomorpha]